MVARMLLVAVTLMANGHAFAQQRHNPQSEKQAKVRRLVDQLDSDKLAKRNQAQRQLVEMGPNVLPLLPVDRNVAASSTRSTLKLIRQALWEQKATASVAESRLVLPAKTTVGEMLTTVKQKSGNSMLIQLPRELSHQRMEFAQHSHSFWESLRELERMTSARVSVGGSPQSLRIRNSTDDARPTSLNGPFRIELLSVGLRNVIGRDDIQLLRIRFRLMTEPRLSPLFLTLTGQSLKVTVDGQTAPPYTPAANVELSLGHSGMQVEFHSDFIVPQGATPKVIDVTGKWRMQLSGGREPFEFAMKQSAAGTRRTKAGVTVGLEQVEQTSDAGGPLIEVVMSVSYRESGKAFESHRNWLGRNDIRLVGAGPEEIGPERMNIELQIDGSAYVRYRFRPKSTQSKRIIFTAPTLITQVDVPVEFRDQLTTVESESR